MYGHILAIPELGKLQQENGKLEVSLSYMEKKEQSKMKQKPKLIWNWLFYFSNHKYGYISMQ